MNLLELKDILDEENYPYFTDTYLTGRLVEVVDEDGERALARELLLKKSGIPGIKLGDIEIPSPKNHFQTLAFSYRKNSTGTVVRADERD